MIGDSHGMPVPIDAGGVHCPGSRQTQPTTLWLRAHSQDKGRNCDCALALGRVDLSPMNPGPAVDAAIDSSIGAALLSRWK